MAARCICVLALDLCVLAVGTVHYQRICDAIHSMSRCVNLSSVSKYLHAVEMYTHQDELVNHSWLYMTCPGCVHVVASK